MLPILSTCRCRARRRFPGPRAPDARRSGSRQRPGAPQAPLSPTPNRPSHVGCRGSREAAGPGGMPTAPADMASILPLRSSGAAATAISRSPSRPASRRSGKLWCSDFGSWAGSRDATLPSNCATRTAAPSAWISWPLRVDNIRPVLSHGAPRPRLFPPCHSSSACHSVD